jgi:aspartyl-tRNA(Asn)/glutamyl-tRNA(Gln) amidotransferase subunit A
MADWHRMTALEQGRAIGAGSLDPVALTEHMLERIQRLDADRAVYLCRTPERALAEAASARGRAKAASRRGPLDGVPISWKDLIDSAGHPTTGGSGLFRDRVPARDAAILARGSRAGLVCLGKTNLTEFAFSGLGINPIYGTPPNPFDATTARVPGGSSSGAAVSVARGLAAAAVGSDTGGSVRIPAAWNGLVGLKTTAGLVPTDGVMALSTTFDTLGPLARDVADANALHAVLAHRPATDLVGATLKGARLVVPTDHMLERVEDGVRVVFEAAVEALARAGATIAREPAPEIVAARELGARHGVVAATECEALWRDAIARDPKVVFHMVRERIGAGAMASGRDLYELYEGYKRLAAAFAARLAGCDAMIAPTVPVDPPAIAPLLADDQAYSRANALSLWNTAPVNWLAGCALTVPCGGRSLPVGLMLAQRGHHEGQLLRLGAAAERALADLPKPALAA